MQIHGAIGQGRGYDMRVTTDEFQGRERLDLRTWCEFRPGDPDSAQPTKKGVNVPASRLPELLAILKRAEAELIRSGHLKAADYTAAGMTVPHELRPEPKSPARPRLVKAG